LSRNVIIFWLALVPFLTIIRTPVITFVVIAGFLFYIQRYVSNAQRLFIFISSMAVVPGWFEFTIGIGATDIYEVRYWKLLVIIILVPAFLNLLKEKLRFDFVDVVFALFVFYHVVHYLFFDETQTFLTAVRLAFDVFLYHFVVYFVFSRVVRQQPREAILYISYGFVILALILSGVFVLNQLANADLYNVHSTAGNVYNLGFLREYRNGFLRTEGPLIGEVMGLLLGAAMLSLFSIKDILKINLFKFIVISCLFLLVCIITGSRGVIFSFLLISAVFTYLRIDNPAVKVALVFLVCIGGVILFFAPTSGIPVQDEFGTFDYRAQLWQTSFEFANNYPFGDSLYANLHYFDHLRRGPTQFLDVVSVYLQYWLPMGYPGLVLYAAPFLITVLQLTKFSFFNPKSAGPFVDPFGVYLALLLGYLFMIITVSDGGLISLAGLIILSVSRGLLVAHKSSLKSNNV